MNEPDLDFFFPVSQVELETRLPRLRELCNSCLHQAACLSFALNNHETDGIWGGKSPEERTHLTKKEEAGTRRFREIQELLSMGLNKEEISAILKIQVASLDRTLDRAKRKGLTQ